MLVDARQLAPRSRQDRPKFGLRPTGGDRATVSIGPELPAWPSRGRGTGRGDPASRIREASIPSVAQEERRPTNFAATVESLRGQLWGAICHAYRERLRAGP